MASSLTHSLQRWRNDARYHLQYQLSNLGLRRVDRHPIPDNPREIRLFLCARNEGGRMPWLLRYYRQLGVNRFFIIDNGSEDDTQLVLQDHKDVHVWLTHGSFQRSALGAHWREKLFRQYGAGHWCVVVDADEMLVYPGCENTPLRALCDSMEAEGCLGLSALWIQMYPDRPVQEAHWLPGADPLDVCGHFDSDSHRPTPHPPTVGWAFNPTKAPLFLHLPDGPRVWSGHHEFQGKRLDRISCWKAAVLHFKFTAELFELCRREMHQDWKYRYFYKALNRRPDGMLTHDRSVPYQGSSQLLTLGLMKQSDHHLPPGSG